MMGFADVSTSMTASSERRPTGRRARITQIRRPCKRWTGSGLPASTRSAGHSRREYLRSPDVTATTDADDGVWRVAFAFDPKRRAVLLVAGDKSGGGEKRFYRQLLRTADARFDEHLASLKKEDKR